MKAFLQKLSRIIPAIVAAAGLPAILYGVWFQTEGFKWAPLLYCVYCAIVAIAGAYFMMRFFDEETRSGRPGAMTLKNGTRSVIQGLWVSFLIGMLVLYRCTSLIAFYLGVLVMLFCWSSLIFHYIFDGVRRRKEKDAAL